MNLKSRLFSNIKVNKLSENTAGHILVKASSTKDEIKFYLRTDITK